MEADHSYTVSPYDISFNPSLSLGSQLYCQTAKAHRILGGGCRVGDDKHAPVLSWQPLLLTPNNPGSPATQTALAGAAEVVLAR